MRRKIGILVLIGLLFLSSAMAVYAAPSDSSNAEAISGYCLGDELHAFIRLKEGYDVRNFKATLQSEKALTDREGSITQIKDTRAIARYVFMIDQSTSMKNYKKQIKAFVDSLMDTEELEAFYTVATFGEQFQVINADLTDKNTVEKVLDELKYKEKKSDPYTGVESALTYLDGYSIRSGDLIYLVLITDGEPYLKGDTEREEELAQSLAERITGAPEVIVSTLCTAEWEENVYQALSPGMGLHETVSDEQSAADAGEKMAEYVDSLYRISFRLSGEPDAERFAVELKLNGKADNGDIASFTLPLEGIPNLKRYSNNEQGGSEESGTPEIGGFLRDPDKAPEKDGKETAEDDPEKDSKETAEDDPKRDDKETAEDDPEKDGKETVEDDPEKDGKETVEDDSEKEWNLRLLLPILGGVIILAGICVMLIARKRKPSQAGKLPKTEQTKGAGAGIPMKLEVYSGKCMRQSATFYLAEPLVIGSAPECDVVFTDPEVAPQNSRIFLKDQMIFIEDLNSTEGTALGGMRIQGQNRLRSGDVISIGNVEFSFKF